MFQKTLVIFLSQFVILSTFDLSFAYHSEIHYIINESAVKKFSQLNNTLNTELGIGEGNDFLITKKNITREAWQWLAYGGEAEDFGRRFAPTTTRAFNHFHDPLKSWDKAGLRGIINLVYVGNYGRFPDSLILWGFDPGRQDFRQNTTGDWSWSKAREFYYTFLTGRNFTGQEIASADKEKKSHLADCLRAVGQVMHLVQDASVPLHTRNDLHLLPGTYETYIKDNLGRHLNNLTAVRPGPEWFTAPQPESAYSYLPPVTALIDRNQYTGHMIPPTNATIGLAEFSNANFLTQDTMWKYPHPRLDDTSYSDSIWHNLKEVSAEDGMKDNRIYFRKVVGEPVEHLMAAAYWFIPLYNSQSPALAYAFLIDETCYADYAARLLPRAVGYSAELLDYFFRGRLQVAPKAIIQDNQTHRFELNIQNMTTNQDPIADGHFSLTIRYTPTEGNPDGSEDVFICSDNVKSGLLQYGQTETYIFNLSEPVPQENYKSLQGMLAYHGNLGREAEAVIGKYFLPEISNPFLLIEMDREYLIWDLAEGNLVTVMDDNGQMVPYPLSYSEINSYLKLHGLKYVSGLKAGHAITPSFSLRTAAPVKKNCRCYLLDPYECLILNDCGVIGGDVVICDEYGENQYGFTGIYRNLQNIWEDTGHECVGFRESRKKTMDYSGTFQNGIPGTNDTFSYEKSFYYHNKWAQISNQYAPPSSGFDSYIGPEDMSERRKRAVLTSAGLDPTARNKKRKFAFFWHQSQRDEHKEWVIDDWDKIRLTVNNLNVHYDYFYRSYITPSLTQESAPILSYSFESGIEDSNTSSEYRIDITGAPVVSGFIDRFAIVLEQPIIIYEKKSSIPREVVRYWGTSKLYIQDNAQPQDPENSASGFIYDWDQLSTIDMNRIFQNFSKTMDEDIAERGTLAGLEISIYSGK